MTKAGPSTGNPFLGLHGSSNTLSLSTPALRLKHTKYASLLSFRDESGLIRCTFSNSLFSLSSKAWSSAPA